MRVARLTLTTIATAVTVILPIVNCDRASIAFTPDIAQNSPPAYASVTGTVTYRERIALPPNALIEVRLLEMSSENAAAVTLARQTIPSTSQVPIPFELSYDRSRINPNYTYGIQALIFVDNKIRFINRTMYPVITQGNPTNVEVVVESPQAGQPRPTPRPTLRPSVRPTPIPIPTLRPPVLPTPIPTPTLRPIPLRTP